MKIKTILNPRNNGLNTKGTIKDALEYFVATGCKKIPIMDDKGLLKGVVMPEAIVKALLAETPLDDSILKYHKTPVSIDQNSNIEDLTKIPVDEAFVIGEKGEYLGDLCFQKLIKKLLNKWNNANFELQTVLDTNNNCIVSIDNQGKITFLNKVAADLLEVKKDNVIGEPVERYINNSRLPEIVKSGKKEIGHRFVYKGRKTFITNRTPIVQDGKIIGAVAIFQDITELQNIMEELTNVKEYKNILETVLDNAYDGIVVVDNDGIVTMFNKAYQDFLGITKENAVGKHVTEVIENTRMHIVSKTGKAEVGDLQKIKGHDVVTMRIPIIKEGECVGSIGKIMFKDIKELKALMEKVSNLKTELQYYKEVVKEIHSSQYNIENIIGQSPQIMEIKAMTKKVALSNSTVLIRGESGTGKELFAHAIHYASPRKYGPFIKVNCSAIPENLLESELFGYEEGAFTGAKKGGKPGKFELANNGTIFLDEIGDMPLNMQVKLLRVLQEKEVDRVGGTKSIPINVRVVVATNRNLEELIDEGKFRMDLFYRLNVVELRIPPLRYRKEDIFILIDFLLNKLSYRMGLPKPTIEQQALNILLSYTWPGNIRELENVLERCLNFVEKDIIKAKHIPFHISKTNFNLDSSMKLKDILDETEKEAIKKALEVCNNDKNEAAKFLGISRAGIYQKICKYNLQ